MSRAGSVMSNISFRSERKAHDTISELNRRLNRAGYDTEVSLEDKLQQLWRMYLEVEANLSRSQRNIEKLRKQQSEEIREIEVYMDKIRNLADDREGITTQLEKENEELRAQVLAVSKKQTPEAEDSTSRGEIVQLLMDEGLKELVEYSSPDVVASLLVMRAELLKDLKSSSVAVDTQADGDKGSLRLSEVQKVQIVELEAEVETLRSQIALGTRPSSASRDTARLRDELLAAHTQLEETAGELRDARRQLMQARREADEAQSESRQLKSSYAVSSASFHSLSEENGRLSKLVAQLTAAAPNWKLQGGEGTGSSAEEARLSEENHRLQLELVSTNEKFNHQLKKYQQLKGQYKQKLTLMKMNQEKQNQHHKDSSTALEANVRNLTRELHNERELSTRVHESNKALLKERGTLLDRVQQADSKQNTTAAELHLATERARQLEEDSGHLRQRGDELDAEKSRLGGELRRLQLRMSADKAQRGIVS